MRLRVSRTPLVHLILRRGRHTTSVSPSLPILSIQNGTFYRNHPSSIKEEGSIETPMFPNLTFSIPVGNGIDSNCAIVGGSKSGKTTLLEVLRGQHLCLPPTARTYPMLSSNTVDLQYRSPAKAIQYVGFDAERSSKTRGAYMSARYESRREETDYSVLDYLKGNTHLNALDNEHKRTMADDSLDSVLSDLDLANLVDMPMSNLSNGQGRRAKIARALLEKPLVLLLDEPFMGLDPATARKLSNLLQRMAEAGSPKLVLALRPQDTIPRWTTKVLRLGPSLQVQKLKEQSAGTFSDISSIVVKFHSGRPRYASPLENIVRASASPSDLAIPWPSYQAGLPVIISTEAADKATPALITHDGLRRFDWSRLNLIGGATLISMKGVVVKYGNKAVIGSGTSGSKSTGLWWDITKGSRWGIFGPNGSGKTTLLSLICSDHPQAYSEPIEFFGRKRLGTSRRRGINIFDLQSKIGICSPEVHAFFPKRLSIRATLENAYADTFLGTPTLTYEIDTIVDAHLRWFEAELNPAYDPSDTPLTTEARKGQPKGLAEPRDTDWADNATLASLPFSAQRIALFLRAIIKKPPIVILDEAFSGLDEYTRNKCHLFLTWGETRIFAYATPSDHPHENQSPEHDNHSTEETKSPYPNKRTVVIRTPKTRIMDHTPIEGLEFHQALLCVSHVREEMPGIVRSWMKLPDPIIETQNTPTPVNDSASGFIAAGKLNAKETNRDDVEKVTGRPAAKFGLLNEPFEFKPEVWDQIWDEDV